MKAAFDQTHCRARGGLVWMPLELTCDLNVPPQHYGMLLHFFIALTAEERLNFDPFYRQWQADVEAALENWIGAVLEEQDREERWFADPNDRHSQTYAAMVRLWNTLAERPKEPDPISGNMEIESLDALLASPWWEDLLAADAALGSNHDVPTTLGKLDADVVHWLLLRGYMHTYVSSLAVKPWSPEEASGPANEALARLERVAHPAR